MNEPVTTGIPTGAEEAAMQAQGAEEHAHKHPAPAQITRKQWKEYLNKFFTVRNFQMPCGHKLLLQRDAEGKPYLPSDPKTNCPMCWFLYFQNNSATVQIADECFREAGRDVLERSRGKKFVKYFLMFMSTMARFQREQAAAAAEKEASSGNEDNQQAGEQRSIGGGSPAADSSEPGPSGEAQSIGGIQSDSGRDSGGPETAVDEGQVEGPEIGRGPVQQGLGD